MDLKSLEDHLAAEIETLKRDGLYKPERVMTTAQAGEVTLADGAKVLNFCANNYLGLADSKVLEQSARQAIDTFGYGMASVRFICGTQTQHKTLEKKLAEFVGMEDCILYSSCFDANGGLFETLFDDNDAIISDALNHASIIDGIRLCKARRFRYANNDMADLEAQLEAAEEARYRLIVTDGVFSMDGIIANLPAICDLADKYNAMVMVDDSHATGFIGSDGRGTPEYWGIQGRVDILTSTLGKALGGASGGFTAAHANVVEWLRQRSRPYLFSNSLSPIVVAASITAVDQISDGHALRDRLKRNARRFRSSMTDLGFDLVPGEHPIIPIMLGDATLAQAIAARMLELGVYVIGFSFPVVPQGKARIRTQMSAAHGDEEVDRAVDAFAIAGREFGVIK